MANGIDLSGYAASYGQSSRIDTSSIREGMNRALEMSKEHNQIRTAKAQNEALELVLKPFKDASITDVSGWGSLNFLGSGGQKMYSAGSAYNEYKKYIASQGNAVLNEAYRQGILDPVKFKQAYDNAKASYMPMINAKLERYSSQKGLTSRELQEQLSGTTNNLTDFLSYNSDPGTLAHEASKYYSPAGLIGGIPVGIGQNPEALATPALGAGIAGATAFGQQLMGTAPFDFSKMGSQALKGASPFHLGTPLKGQGRAWLAGKSGYLGDTAKKDVLKWIKKDLKPGEVFNPEAEKTLKKVKDRVSKAQREATTNLNKEFKKKYGTTWNKGSAQAKSAFKKKNKLAKDLIARQAKFKSLNKAASEKMVKSSEYALKRLLQKVGTKGLISTIAKKVGMKQAILLGARLAAGTALSATGVGTVVGLGINALTLYELGKLASDILKETGGFRRPDKMIFGGR